MYTNTHKSNRWLRAVVVAVTCTVMVLAGGGAAMASPRKAAESAWARSLATPRTATVEQQCFAGRPKVVVPDSFGRYESPDRSTVDLTGRTKPAEVRKLTKFTVTPDGMGGLVFGFGVKPPAVMTGLWACSYDDVRGDVMWAELDHGKHGARLDVGPTDARAFYFTGRG